MPQVGTSTIALVTGYVSLDTAIALVVFVIAAAFAYRVGAGRVIALTLALFISYSLQSALMQSAYIGAAAKSIADGTYGTIILFVAVAVLVYIAFTRMIAADRTATTRFIEAVLSAGGLTLMLFTLWSIMPGIDVVWKLSTTTHHFFNASYAFWLFFGSLGLAALARGSDIF